MNPVRFAAVHTAVKILCHRGAGLTVGNCIITRIVAAPDKDVVLARFDSYIELVAVLEFFPRSIDPSDKLARGRIEEEKRHTLHFLRECIGILHVVGVFESHGVVAFHAIAVIIDNAVATA